MSTDRKKQKTPAAGPAQEGEMIWNRLKHFNKNERWGDPWRMNGLLLLLTDAIRDEMGAKFIIHFGNAGKHISGSQHYPGNAEDGHFETDISYYSQILRLENVLKGLQVESRVGLGLYPVWLHPGFHLDVRGFRARWGWIGELNPDGSKKYCSYERAKAFAEAMK